MRRAAPLPDPLPTKAWAASLGGGLVASLAVWALLEGLRRAVNDVDESIDAVWTAGKRLAQNTQAVHLLAETQARGGELVEELERHRQLNDRSGS